MSADDADTNRLPYEDTCLTGWRCKVLPSSGITESSDAAAET
jgi:hypothetical protein